MKPLLEGAIELPLDKYRIRIDELEKDDHHPLNTHVSQDIIEQ